MEAMSALHLPALISDNPLRTSLLILALQSVLSSLTLGFTTQSPYTQSCSSLLVRLILFPIIFGLAVFQVICLCPIIEGPALLAFVGPTASFIVIAYLDTVLLSQWTFEARGPTSALGGLVPVPIGIREKYDSKQKGGFWERLKFGTWAVHERRFVGTEWESSNGGRRSDSSDSTRCRWRFVLRRIAKGVALVGVLRVVEFVLPRDELAAALLREGIGGVTGWWSAPPGLSGPVGVRVGIMLAWWVTQYANLNMAHSFISALVVGLGLSRAEAWPPLFGRLDELTGVRVFWGRFWHQLLRRGCSGIANFVTCHIFNMRKGGLVSSYVFLTLVFAVSGAFHAVVDLAHGIPLSESGSMKFFCTQALGIILEDFIRAIFFPKNPGGQSHSRSSRLLKNIAAHLWLVTWLVWTTPGWVIPALQRGTSGSLAVILS